MGLQEILILIGIGLAAGVLGGLLGIGGSVLMIPILTLLLRHDQHESQAAAMIINVVIAIPSVSQHRRAGVVPWRAIGMLLPAGILFIVLGVEASNLMDGSGLMLIFGVFLIYVIYQNVRKLLGGRKRVAENYEHPVRVTWFRCSLVGVITGFASGLLGIGGGIICVPLLQRIVGLPLRHAIAGSSGVMCITAVIGAVRKNMTLSQLYDASGLPLDPAASLLIAAWLAPTAIIGGLLGATLTHALPIKWIRLVFVVLLTVACIRFLMSGMAG